MKNIMTIADDQFTAFYGTRISSIVPTIVSPTVAVSERAHMVFAGGLAAKRIWTSGPRRT